MNISFSQTPAGVPKSLATERKALLSRIRYQLHFYIPDQKEQPVKATAIISFSTKDPSKAVTLDFIQPAGTIRFMRVNGKQEAIHYTHEHLIISPRFLVKGINKVNIFFEAGSNALNRNNEYMYTLFVPERARSAFPCFDQPDLKAIFELTLDIPKEWVAMSNGEATKITPKGVYKEWQFEPSDTISAYLFAFTAGKYKTERRKKHGRDMQFFYRETDSVKLSSSMEAIFDLHDQSLQFMEKYTGIAYPFKKFSFTAIPDFQFGGMEHPGAVWYHASSLFLDSSATRTQLIQRTNLIAHETAHMWFGDLVTMKWFDDVWMKEVFANFMADKIAHGILPDDNADLTFMTDHFPAAYSVDRTKGANPIRQPLSNLNEAGSLYGNIIYHKAPIMMQQLEKLIGEKALQDGLKIYLHRYIFGNATWPDLVNILDAGTPEDLAAWNEDWVNKAGRLSFNKPLTNVQENTYGLFTVDTLSIHEISSIADPVLRAFSWLNLYENTIEGRYLSPGQFIMLSLEGLTKEKEELICQMLLNELPALFWVYLSPADRNKLSGEIEEALLSLMTKADQPNLKKIFFKTWVGISVSDNARDFLYNVWKKKSPPPGVNLTDDEYTGLAAELAIRKYPLGQDILKEELERIQNPDKKMRWSYLLASLSDNEKTRDEFFESLKKQSERQKESWVITAVAYLHHPLRERQSVKYITPSLELLQAIQQTGDIFFPSSWLQATLGEHQSAEAEKAVRDFLNHHPDYNPRLLNKLLQAADPLFRARKILGNY